MGICGTLSDVMDEKTLVTLEYDKILRRLAGYAAFSVSAHLALQLRPSPSLEEVARRQAFTTQARHLISLFTDFSVSGAHDIRPYLDLASRSGVLTPAELLEIKNTLLVASQVMHRLKVEVKSGAGRSAAPPAPALAEFFKDLQTPTSLLDVITQSISERGEILDNASVRLGIIRREIKVSHDRLMGRLERIVNDPKTALMLQESIITQRNGRYVIPLRADFKGQIRSIIHDQSSSGATLFVEPLAVVELNNQLQEAILAERDEERRILTELSHQVGENAAAIHCVVDALAQLDLALMCARYAEDLRASEPLIVPFQSKARNHPGSVVRLFQARHPLLDPDRVVAIDLDLDENTFALVLTGPNTGGKTVTLKTAGLLVLMAQSGLHIPAQSGSMLSLFENVFADIGDEQSIEQSLSTFSAHITNIIRILQQADSRSLILLDELGAGTDPQEGAALARGILAHLVEKRIPCLVATHYPELKTYAHATPGVTNACLEFDLQTLCPTYRLVIGLPGQSNALTIAERLGLPSEIITTARSALGSDALRAEDLLAEIHTQRDLARKARIEAESLRQDAEKKHAELERRLEQIEDERYEALEKARQQAEDAIESLQEEIKKLRRELVRARQPLEALQPLAERAEALKDRLLKPPAPAQNRTRIPARPLKVGQRVRLRSLKTQGVITAIQADEVEVLIGSLRMRTSVADIQRSASEEEEETTPSTPPSPRASSSARPFTRYTPSPGAELDLRGKTTEEALEALEKYIESAYLAGLPFVRIIHGKGTGRLRQAVRDSLRCCAYVSAWETGLDGEGGEGVTIARFAQMEK